MGAKSQKKGADGERELVEHLRRAGYSVSWGGNRTYGAVPDASGLPGVHIECKRVEQLNIGTGHGTGRPGRSPLPGWRSNPVPPKK